MSFQRLNIELSPQQFRQRFKVVREMYDPFARHYFIAEDQITDKRAIYKHYLAETEQQLEAIYDNIQNYIKLSQQQGICKILAYTRLIDEQEVLATFQYNDLCLGEYIMTKQFLTNKPLFYIQLLQQLTAIIRSMSEIGIDVDQLNYGNILVVKDPDNLQIKIFYDQREKTFEKVLEGIKTFTSIEKLTALVTGNEDYFNEQMQLDDGISPQNIYQLGLLLIDMIYKCENDPSLQQDDFLVRDRPVSRSSVLMNDEKSYFLFEDGMVKQNHEYLNDKLTSLRSNTLHVIKQLTRLGQAMMARQEERVKIYELPGEIDRVYKIYRDSSKKTLRSQSNQSQKRSQTSSQNSKSSIKSVNESQNIQTNLEQLKKSADKNPSNSKPVSVQASSSSTQSQKQTVQQNHNLINNLQHEHYAIQNYEVNESQQKYIETQFQKQDIQSQLPSLNPMIKKKKQVHQVDTFALGNDQGTNLSNYHQGLTNNYHTNYEEQHKQHFTAYSSQSYQYTTINSQKQYKQAYNTMTNTIESLGDKGIITTNLINQNFNSNATINYPESQGSKKNSSMSQNKLDVSNQKPIKLIIPKQTILMSLKTHESIRSSLETLINEVQNLSDLRKKQYYDNSVYYGGVNPLTNKRTGLGIYLYPSGDIYFGTWLQNQLVDGTYIFKNGQSYEGSVKNGKQGWGRYRYSNGNVYEGEWKDDIKEGKGTMWYPNQDKYQGQWVKGKKNGWGKYFYNNGTIYQGNFLNGRKQGFGTITFTNGTKIEANWQQTHVQGQGKVFYPNGDFFQGQYYMSQKHGKGLYIWGSDNTKYEGQFKKDSLQGEARIYFTSNEYYYGRIRNGRRDGQGNYVYENGDSFTGQWKNDMKLIGHYRFKNGDEFQGKFKDNQLNFGVLRYNNGETYEGEFKNGCRHGVGSYRDQNGQLVCQGHWQNDNFVSQSQ